MSLTDRDRKLVMFILPAVALLAFWFLLIAPQRKEASQLSDALAQQQEKRDAAKAEADRVSGSKNSYASDYETVVRLGKAIPTTVDMPALIVQLDSAAKGTGIRFRKITAGERVSAAPAAAPADSGAGGDTTASTPASESGGEAAATPAGQATEAANDASETSDQANADAGADSTQSGAADPAAAGGAPGLDSVPLTFTFDGSFFDLADLFHRLKRFVRVSNEQIRVRGRLMVVDGFTFKTKAFPTIEAEVTATVYLAPKAEGATAGATPGGPAAPEEDSGSQSASSAPASPPTAAVTAP